MVHGSRPMNLCVHDSSHRLGIVSRLPVALLLLGSILFLSACVAAMPAQSVDGGTGAGTERLSDISEYELPTPEAIIVPDVKAVVNTVGSRANVRTGPALDSPIIAKALPGDEFTCSGRATMVNGGKSVACAVRRMPRAKRLNPPGCR